MKSIQDLIARQIGDRDRLARLLSLEKERRGVPRDALVFVGTANVAKHWWCTQQAVLHSRANEHVFLSTYLSDRIAYAHRPGLVTKLPKSFRALLNLGSEITLDDVERLLKDRGKRSKGVGTTLACEDRVNEVGERIRLINPDLPPEEKQFWVERAAAEGIRVADLEEDPKWRGSILQSARAERYPTIRWHFPWDCYCVVGMPDGLTEDFVYEYKTARSRFLLRFMKPVAFAQANLYGFFFRRAKKRVQIHVVEENVTETYEQSVTARAAEDTLTSFARVDGGEPAHLPKAWKCKNCDFRATCPICQAK